MTDEVENSNYSTGIYELHNKSETENACDNTLGLDLLKFYGIPFYKHSFKEKIEWIFIIN